MRAIIRHELRLTRKTQAVWLALMLILSGFCYFEFLSLKDSLDEMAAMIHMFPRLLMIMFGAQGDLSTAIGWYGCMYFWTGLLAYPYAMYLGLSCVARELERGTAEYLFTKPVSRTEIVLGKSAAAAIQLAGFAAFAGVCNQLLIISPMGGLERPLAVLTTTAGLYLTQLVFLALGLCVAGCMQPYKKAVRVSTTLMLACYTVKFAAEYTGVRALDLLTPLRYFDVYDVTVQGFGVLYLLLAAGLIAGCMACAVRRWNGREA